MQNATGIPDTERPPYVGSINPLETEMGEGVERYRVPALGSKLGLIKFGVNHETIFSGGRSPNLMLRVKKRNSFWF